MNESAVVFQYLLENVPDDWPIALKFGNFDIELDDKKLLVTKTLSSKRFEASDPDCAEKITDFLLEDEEDAIAVNFDMWFRVVSEKKLADVGQKAREIINLEEIHVNKLKADLDLGILYEELMNDSWPNRSIYDCDNSIYLENSRSAWKDLVRELEEMNILKKE